MLQSGLGATYRLSMDNVDQIQDEDKDEDKEDEDDEEEEEEGLEG